jgi:fucose permease
LGPLLPVLIPHWSLTDAEAGQLFLAQFLSSTAAAACSGAIASRIGISRSIAGAYSGMGIALASAVVMLLFPKRL